MHVVIKQESYKLLEQETNRRMG